MKIKRYVGRNAQEAMMKVKLDMGSDAIILNTQKVRPKGILRLFVKPQIEVLAAMDDDAYAGYKNLQYNGSEKKAVPRNTTSTNTSVENKAYRHVNVSMGDAAYAANAAGTVKGTIHAAGSAVQAAESPMHAAGKAMQPAGSAVHEAEGAIYAAGGAVQPAGSNVARNTVQTTGNTMYAAGGTVQSSGNARQSAGTTQTAENSLGPYINLGNGLNNTGSAMAVSQNIPGQGEFINSELERLSQIEKKLLDIEKIMEQLAYGKDSLSISGIKSGNHDEKLLNAINRNLKENGVADEVIEKITGVVRKKRSEGTQKDLMALYYEVIRDILGKPRPIVIRDDGKPTVCAFVGPTGVGKTTTIAKIAAIYSLNQKKKVAFATTDTYRIAAVEQLKIYADILNLPIEVIYSPEDAKEKLSRLSDMDLILMDTAGISHRNSKQVEETHALIEAAGVEQIYLLMSITSSWNNCKDVIDSYSFLKDINVIFTKLDESVIYGNILNSCFYTGKPVSYITNGQNVPDDILLAENDFLVKKVLGRTAE